MKLNYLIKILNIKIIENVLLEWQLLEYEEKSRSEICT